MGQRASAPRKRFTAQDRAVLKLKLQRDELTVYQRKLNALVAAQEQRALADLKANQRERALVVIRGKKQLQGFLDSAAKQLQNIEQLTMTLEFAQMNKSVLEELQRGASVLQALNKAMPLARIDKVMHDTAEGLAHQNEVSSALGQPLQADEEVETELQALEAMCALEKAAALPTNSISNEGAMPATAQAPLENALVEA